MRVVPTIVVRLALKDSTLPKQLENFADQARTMASTADALAVMVRQAFELGAEGKAPAIIGGNGKGPSD